MIKQEHIIKYFPKGRYLDHGMYHVKFTTGWAYFKENIAGCGTYLMYDYSDKLDSLEPEEIQSFKDFMQYFKKEGVGLLITVLGQNHMHLEPKLLELGFKKKQRYINYRHGSDYYQTMYTLDVQKNLKND